MIIIHTLLTIIYFSLIFYVSDRMAYTCVRSRSIVSRGNGSYIHNTCTYAFFSSSICLLRRTLQWILHDLWHTLKTIYIRLNIQNYPIWWCTFYLLHRLYGNPTEMAMDLPTDMTWVMGSWLLLFSPKHDIYNFSIIIRKWKIFN